MSRRAVWRRKGFLRDAVPIACEILIERTEAGQVKILATLPGGRKAVRYVRPENVEMKEV